MKLLLWVGGAFAIAFISLTVALTAAFGGAQSPNGCQTTGPAPAVPSGVLTQAQIEALWVQVGGPRGQAQIAGAVGMAESHGDPNAMGPVTRYGRAIGVMQILGAVIKGDLRNPVVNMRNAVKKWHDAPNGGRNWSPWTTFTGGDYLAYMGKGGPTPAAVPVVCAPIGSGNFGQSAVLYDPRAYADLPQWAMNAGRAPEQVDARILDDAEWILREYHLRVNAARESGHNTHGDGTALDMVPQIPYSWDATALRLAHDAGWTEACAASGVAPVCPLKSWVRGIFYNGFANHGDPEHCSGTCGPHIHISWFASHYGASALAPPNDWVRVFAVDG